MNKFLITAILSLVGFQSLADSNDYKADAVTLFVVTTVKESCASEFAKAAAIGLKIIEVTQTSETIDGSSIITTIMKTGSYAHPLTGSKPVIYYTLKVIQSPRTGPTPADAGNWYQATCELINHYNRQ